jgi:hypothetical protein
MLARQRSKTLKNPRFGTHYRAVGHYFWRAKQLTPYGLSALGRWALSGVAAMGQTSSLAISVKANLSAKWLWLRESLIVRLSLRYVTPNFSH